MLCKLDPFEILTDEVGHPLWRPVDVQHGNHVGMGDARRGLSFALKARERVSIARVLGMQDLHRYTLLGDARMACRIDAAHAALAEDALHLVCPVQAGTRELIVLV